MAKSRESLVGKDPSRRGRSAYFCFISQFFIFTINIGRILVAVEVLVVLLYLVFLAHAHFTHYSSRTSPVRDGKMDLPHYGPRFPPKGTWVVFYFYLHLRFHNFNVFLKARLSRSSFVSLLLILWLLKVVFTLKEKNNNNK